MLLKIISGGQTGVDQAALDAAIKMDIEHGGWVPRGRLTEEGVLPAGYALKETKSADYAERTAKNVADADATLIISQGPLSGGTALTLRLAKESGRPWLHIDLKQQAAFQAAVNISKWLSANKIEILNVAGPRSSKDPQIYAKTRKLLETVFYLELIHSDPASISSDLAGRTATEKTALPLPVKVDDAALQLVSEMALRDRVTLANLAEIELAGLSTTLGNFVLNRFDLDHGNTELLEACRWESRTLSLTAPEAAALIIRSAWKKLQKTHKLRVVDGPPG